MKRKIKIAIPQHLESKWEKFCLCRLLLQKYDVRLSDKPDLFLYLDVGYKHKFTEFKCIRVFCTAENHKPNLEVVDYAFSYEETDDKNFYLPCFAWHPLFEEFRAGRYSSEIKKYREHLKSRFCAFVYGGYGYERKERMEFCRKLMSYKRVDCPGRSLNNMPRVGPSVKDKFNFIKQHKFTITFENASSPNYVTEKIFHTLLVNSVPIYWGSPRIAEYFNPEAFINCHDYDSFDRVIERVIEVDNNDDLYRKYVNAPPILEGSKVYAITEEAIMERLDKIVDSIGVMTPVCRTMSYQWLRVKALKRRLVKF